MSTGAVMKSRTTALPWHPTLSPHFLAGLLLRWAFPCPTSIFSLCFFPAPAFRPSHLNPPYPLAYFTPPWTEEGFLATRPQRLPFLRSCDLLLHFPLFGTPSRKDICLIPWTVFKKRDYVQVGINVQNSHLSAIWAFGE